MAGFVLGVPTFGVIYALIKYKVNNKLKEKNLPEDTTPYITVGSIEDDGTFMEYVPTKNPGFLEVLGLNKEKFKKKSRKTEKVNDGSHPET